MSDTLFVTFLPLEGKGHFPFVGRGGFLHDPNEPSTTGHFA